MLALARTVLREGIPVYELRLPKGHIDPGETAEHAALREVGEESGYWKVEVTADLGLSHSSFRRDGVQYERDERYFLMRLIKEARENPQPVSEEEALFEPQWLDPAEALSRLTFPTEKEFAARALNILNTGYDPQGKACFLDNT